mgnify:CR=1 FL=1
MLVAAGSAGSELQNWGGEDGRMAARARGRGNSVRSSQVSEYYAVQHSSAHTHVWQTDRLTDRLTNS